MILNSIGSEPSNEMQIDQKYLSNNLHNLIHSLWNLPEDLTNLCSCKLETVIRMVTLVV